MHRKCFIACELPPVGPKGRPGPKGWPPGGALRAPAYDCLQMNEDQLRRSLRGKALRELLIYGRRAIDQGVQGV